MKDPKNIWSLLSNANGRSEPSMTTGANMAKTRYTRITSSFLHKVLLLCKTTHRVYYTFYTRENHLHNAYTHFHQFPHSDNLPVFYLTNSLTHTHAHSRTLTHTHPHAFDSRSGRCKRSRVCIWTLQNTGPGGNNILYPSSGGQYLVGNWSNSKELSISTWGHGSGRWVQSLTKNIKSRVWPK